MQDVTDRHQVEADLREKTTLLERAQQVAKIGSWVIDLKQGTLLWSPSLASMLGEEESGIVRSSAEFRARYVHEDDVERWSAVDGPRLRRGRRVHDREPACGARTGR